MKLLVQQELREVERRRKEEELWMRREAEKQEAERRDAEKKEAERKRQEEVRERREQREQKLKEKMEREKEQKERREKEQKEREQREQKEQKEQQEREQTRARKLREEEDDKGQATEEAGFVSLNQALHPTRQVQARVDGDRRRKGATWLQFTVNNPTTGPWHEGMEGIPCHRSHVKVIREFDREGSRLAARGSAARPFLQMNNDEQKMQEVTV